MISTYRSYKVDFLRGVAILIVLLLHFNISYRLDHSALTKVFSSGFINAIAFNGNYGVTLFFVISGFLITSTSLERYGSLANIDPVSFYIFRFSRIIPCLLLVLGLIALFSFCQISIFQNDAQTTSLSFAIFSVLTFWHNILMQKIGYFNYCLNIFWSLSVEEVFYLAFPLLCVFFKRTRFIVLFWIALIVIAPIYRSYHSDNEIIALYGYLSCFDAIAVGCVAALIVQKIQLKKIVCRLLMLSAWLLIMTVYLYSGIMENVVIGVTLMALGAGMFLIAAANMSNETSHKNFLIKIICWFGKNSYELYLFHIVVLALMKTIMKPEVLDDYTKLLWMVVFLGLSTLLAGFISRFYSQPLNKKIRSVLLASRTPQSVVMVSQ